MGRTQDKEDLKEIALNQRKSKKNSYSDTAEKKIVVLIPNRRN